MVVFRDLRPFLHYLVFEKLINHSKIQQISVGIIIQIRSCKMASDVKSCDQNDDKMPKTTEYAAYFSQYFL